MSLFWLTAAPSNAPSSHDQSCGGFQGTSGQLILVQRRSVIAAIRIIVQPNMLTGNQHGNDNNHRTKKHHNVWCGEDSPRSIHHSVFQLECCSPQELRRKISTICSSRMWLCDESMEKLNRPGCGGEIGDLHGHLLVGGDLETVLLEFRSRLHLLRRFICF